MSLTFNGGWNPIYAETFRILFDRGRGRDHDRGCSLPLRERERERERERVMHIVSC